MHQADKSKRYTPPDRQKRQAKKVRRLTTKSRKKSRKSY